MEWFKVAPHLPTDTNFIKPVSLNGRHLLLINNDGTFYATQSKCPHAGADLQRGWCKDGHLVCPYHRYQYNLSTGRGAEGQGDYIEIYPVEVREDGIYIGIRKKRGLFEMLFGN